MKCARAAMILGAVLFLAPVQASAQETEAKIRELTALLAVERQRVAELQTEIERRTAALAEISARLAGLAPSTTVEPPAMASAATAPPRFDFYGDATFRLANQTQRFAGCDGCPGRTFGRLRLRLGTEGHLAPGLRVVMGFGIGELNNPNTIYQTLGGDFTRKVATWDRGFMEFRPAQAPWLDLTAGKFPYTWLRSSMTFDVDFYPEGLSERFPFDVKHGGPLKNVTLQGLQLVVNERADGPDTIIVGGQAAGTIQPFPRLTTTVAWTQLDIKQPDHLLHDQLSGIDPGVLNTNGTREEAGQVFYASGFRYANVIVENVLRTRWDALPVTGAIEYHRNLRAARGVNTGKSVRLDIGRPQRQGDWGFGWHLFRVEQDAIIAALGESDWRAPSNVVQHRFAVNRMLHQHVQAAFTWYRGRTLDRLLPGATVLSGAPSGKREPWRNLIYLDLIYRY